MWVYLLLPYQLQRLGIEDFTVTSNYLNILTLYNDSSSSTANHGNNASEASSQHS